MPLDAAPDRLREVLAPLQGLALTPETWERDVLPRRLGSYDRAWLDRLCAAGEVVWTGAGSGSGRGGRVALYFREDAPFLGPPHEPSGDGPPRPRARRAARAARRRRRVLVGPARRPRRARRSTCAMRCGTWSGRARSRTMRSRRCARGGCRSRRRCTQSGRRRRFGVAAHRLPAAASGPLEPDQPPVRAAPDREGARSGPRRAAARAPRARGARDGGRGAGSGRVRERVRGAGGARDARLRAARVLRRRPRRRAVRAVRGGRAAAHAPRGGRGAVVLAAQDPANLYGAVLPWPRREEQARRPARVPGAYVVLLDGPRGSLCRGRRPRAGVARRPLGGVAARSAGRARRVRALPAARCGGSAIERWDGEPVLGSAVEELLVGATGSARARAA